MFFILAVYFVNNHLSTSVSVKSGNVYFTSATATPNAFNLITVDKFQGWKMVLDTAGAWVQYNSVDFGNKKLRSVVLRAMSPEGGTLQIRTHDKDGPVVAEVPVSAGSTWQLVKAPLLKFEPGIQHLFVSLKGNNEIAVDWIRFE